MISATAIQTSASSSRRSQRGGALGTGIAGGGTSCRGGGLEKDGADADTTRV
jgi:hypothetical protein